MEHRSRVRLLIWPRCLQHGSRRLQSQVVRHFPRYCPKRFQRIRQQLVERALCTPTTRFPEVCTAFKSRDLFLSSSASDMTSSKHYPSWAVSFFL